MVPYLSERENAIEDVHSICQRLFDRWCEGRNAAALSYLMRCWPLMDSEPRTLRKLDETLREYTRQHRSTVDRETLQMLGELADSCAELLHCPSAA
ncbi:hypothetical protein FAZ69_28705 [Trinickia terrae]|uniref:Uncharacterized protein n=1 Tax=Trinickia terrae TaxID=2571161 RepID=A0A4U1HJI3_9BURK|nr:hypothetical protein [Trinickia terrae]TKC81311.1 hypothetical protein FAZ69_28705 [Trinickia terrae]